MYLYDYFSLFLGVQSAPEVGPTSYETPCISSSVEQPRESIRISFVVVTFRPKECSRT